MPSKAFAYLLAALNEELAKTSATTSLLTKETKNFSKLSAKLALLLSFNQFLIIKSRFEISAHFVFVVKMPLTKKSFVKSFNSLLPVKATNKVLMSFSEKSKKSFEAFWISLINASLWVRSLATPFLEHIDSHCF